MLIMATQQVAIESQRDGMIIDNICIIPPNNPEGVVL